MLSVFVAALAALIPITNPIGAVAAYAGLSAHLDADERFTPELVREIENFLAERNKS